MCEIIEEIAQKRANSIIEEIAEKKAENVLIEKIKVVMNRLNDTAEKAMEFLDIPKEQWAHYKSML